MRMKAINRIKMLLTREDRGPTIMDKFKNLDQSVDIPEDYKKALDSLKRTLRPFKIKYLKELINEYINES